MAAPPPAPQPVEAGAAPEPAGSGGRAEPAADEVLVEEELLVEEISIDGMCGVY